MDSDKIQQAIDTIVPLITTYGLQILGAIAILIVGRLVANILAGFMRRSLEKANVEPSLVGFLSSLVKFAVMAFAVIAALAKFGVQTASFVAVLGAAGFAIGFALQGSLSNFASGVMLLIFRPIKVGDLIEAEGYLGIVEDIGIFVTIVNTLDHQRVIMPNSVLTSGVLNNVNGNGIRRVDMTAGISYTDDVQKAKRILQQILDDHPKVLADPAPQVAVCELGDSSVNFVVRPWCKGDDYWDVNFDVTEAIKAQFDAQGVSIPFPQRDVHLFQAQS